MPVSGVCYDDIKRRYIMHTFIKTFLLLVFLPVACAPSDKSLPGGLILEEHVLTEAPTSAPFIFQPAESTQDEILARHADERRQVIPIPVFFVDGNPALKASWGGDELTAVIFTDSGNGPEQIVKVFTPTETLFVVSAGMPSPVMPLQGLWTYDRHWALEILYASPETWEGRIFIDGDLINQDKNYDEAFGFQLLSGKPFFFYSKAGQIGISYDGQEAGLGYEKITHYQCCSGSVLNPIPAENMVAFFAQKDGTWYYVELGNFR